MVNTVISKIIYVGSIPAILEIFYYIKGMNGAGKKK